VTDLPPPRRSVSRERHRCNLPEPRRRGAVAQCTRCHRRYTARRLPDLSQMSEPLGWRRRWWPWPRPTKHTRWPPFTLPRSTSRDVEAIERHWYGPDS
jgi:hypothetical protein